MTFKRFLTVCAGVGLPLAFALQAPQRPGPMPFGSR
jgi:hypothetical protein